LNQRFSRAKQDIVVFYYTISENVFEESREDTLFLVAPRDKNQHFHNQVEILYKKKHMDVQ
jgi:hypothetical protein